MIVDGIIVIGTLRCVPVTAGTVSFRGMQLAKIPFADVSVRNRQNPREVFLDTDGKVD